MSAETAGPSRAAGGFQPNRGERGDPVAVLGAGSWGTALAIQFARSGHPTRFWGRNREALAAMAASRRNERYLSAEFPASLVVEPDLAAALAGARDALIAVPSHAFRGMLRQLVPHLTADTRLAWATKGFELDTGLLPHQVAREVLGSNRAVAVLSGPTFAREVGEGLPTAMTIASPDAEFAREAKRQLDALNGQFAHEQSDEPEVQMNIMAPPSSGANDSNADTSGASAPTPGGN